MLATPPGSRYATTMHRLPARFRRDGMSKMVKIRYAKDETGWAEEMANGTYRIDNIPLTDQLNMDDLVRCRLNDAGVEQALARVIKYVEQDVAHRTPVPCLANSPRVGKEPKNDR
jgi:hypothetical protein